MNFYKITLTLYKPFHDFATLKSTYKSYQEALLAYMDNDFFPRPIAASIRKLQKNIRYHKEEEGAFHHVQSSPNKNTPETANENVMAAMQISEMGNQLESSKLGR